MAKLIEFLRLSTFASGAWSRDLRTKGPVAGAGLSRPGRKAATGDQTASSFQTG